MSYIVVLITAPSKNEAKKIANAIVESKVAACVNIVPMVESVFMWKGKKENAKESLLIVKTKKSCFEKLKQKVKKLHSYTTPEIISIPILQGEKSYLDWISKTVS